MSHANHRDPLHTPAGFFVLRAPLLPFDALLAWSGGLAAPAAAGAGIALDQALDADRARLRARLRAVFERPTARDALFVASPDLEGSLDRWVAAPESERGQKVERALVRYFARMAGRATPFGLFAGWSVGEVGGATRLEVAERAACQRHTRLDMDYLFALADALGRDKALRAALRYAPNSSLYRSGGRLRYAEATVRERARSYQLVAVELTDALATTLERARGGATVAALVAGLVGDDPEIAVEEAAAYVEELIASQILVPELAPAVTGDEPIHGLIAQLRAHPSSAPIAQTLDRVRTALNAIDADGVGVDPERYRAVAGLLEGLPVKMALPRLFQVDMARPAPRLALGADLIGEIQRGVELLRRITPQGDALARFRAAFAARYEDRAVPLAEALDEESGIGLGTPRSQGADASVLLGGLSFPSTTEHAAQWTARHTLLLRKVEDAARRGDRAIELTSHELDAMAVRDPLPLPDSFAVMATAVARDQQNLQVAIHGVVGPSGARMLGRFCHADRALHERVAAMLHAEEALAADTIFAEVVHLPEGRIGNILCRPILRDYEIPFLGRSGADPAQQIPIDDLLVSVVGDEVVLRSARLGKRILPRLTSAHNYGYGLNIYKFLCMLQSQGVAGGLHWSWGPLAGAAFLPRVTSGRLVLARAHWWVDGAELKALGQAHGAARFAAVQAWRGARGLPRLILLEEADNELPVDLDNVLSVESFVELVKDRREIALVELFPGPDQLAADGPDGRFVHELIVPFVRSDEGPRTTDHGPRTEHDQSVPLSVAKGPTTHGRRSAIGDHHPDPLRTTPREPRHAPSIARRFPPGSEWLYAKLYTGTAAADQALREVVAPVARAAERSGAIDRWFFIRYNDPDHHLRVRFHGPPALLYGEVLPALHQAARTLLDDGRVWRVQLDTYEREVERYGGAAGIELAEQLFHADSAAALAIVERGAGDAAVAQRWRLALRGIDALLNDLAFDLEARHALIRQARDSFAREFHADAALTRQLGDAYRRQRKQLESLLDPALDDAALRAGLAALRARSDRLAPLVAALRARERDGLLAVNSLALSFTHMHANRLLRSAQRRQELVIYEFLDRLYQARAARSRNSRS